MGDPLKKVKTGDPLAIPAAAFNAFVDAARDFRGRGHGVARDARADLRPGGIVLVKNASVNDQNHTVDQDRFAVLGIDGPIITPTDNADEFKSRVAIKCVTPSTAHAGRFVILAEPLAKGPDNKPQDGAIGQAFIDGVCPVKIDITDEDHQYADVDDGETGNLKSGAAGAAQILWAESGTGVKWAIVRFGFHIHIPAGGDQYMVLAKISYDDFDMDWGWDRVVGDS